MIRLIKDKLNDNTLNDALKSFNSTINDLRSSYDESIDVLNNNLLTINGWMQNMNNYYYNLMGWKAYLESLEEQGVIVPKDPVYLWVSYNEVSSTIHLERMQWTTKPAILNSNSKNGKRIDETNWISEEEALYLIANGSDVYFAYFVYKTNPNNDTFDHWEIGTHTAGDCWNVGYYEISESSFFNRRLNVTNADWGGSDVYFNANCLSNGARPSWYDGGYA